MTQVEDDRIRIGELGRILAEVEWRAADVGPGPAKVIPGVGAGAGAVAWHSYPACPICNARRVDGHRDGCRLATVLKGVKR